MSNFKFSLAACAVALVLPYGVSIAGVPYPTIATPKALDAGPLSASVGVKTQTVTIAMKLRDPDGARALFKSISTVGDANYQKFLTPDEFRARFAPTAADVAKITASLAKFGLTVEQASSTTLRVSGSPAAIEAAFAVSLHQFSVPAQGHVPGYSFHSPLTAPQVSSDIAPLVHAVIGLDTRPHFHPNIRRSAAESTLAKTPAIVPPASGGGNQLGSLTVTDFASIYNVTPLYHKGVTGKGKTLAIITLASFTTSDAFAYWSAVGLTVDPNRITVVNIDGGPGAPSDASGSDETTLDVEQSGGVAPGAKIVVYQAPNTNQGYLDAFAAAIDTNQAESMSTSWGNWEWFNNFENSPVTDPFTGQSVSELRAFDELFLQAALQGQSMFAAAGDAGAYDVNREAAPPNYSLALSVDSPASDPFITAAGGTTLPAELTFAVNATQDVTVKIKKERVWSWDYLIPLCTALGYDPIACGIFPVGGGGGVSFEFKKPFYQDLVSGTQATQPDQALVDETQIPPQTIFALPAHFRGRNVPDVSFNADPETGYALYYTSDQTGFGIYSGNGGTSFVAPQLNGVTALLNQSTHSRLGLLNVPMYWFASHGGYNGSHAPLRAITDGNNDFYYGSTGYGPGAGLGVLNVSNFADALKVPF